MRRDRSCLRASTWPTARNHGRGMARLPRPFPLDGLVAPSAAALLLVALLVVVLLKRLVALVLVLRLAARLVHLGLLQVRIRAALAVALGERNFQLIELVPFGIRPVALGDGEQFLQPLPRRLGRRGGLGSVDVVLVAVLGINNGDSLELFRSGSQVRAGWARCASAPTLARSSTVIALAMKLAASFRFAGTMSVLPALASCLNAST